MTLLLLLILCNIIFAISAPADKKQFELSIIHFNDFHSRFEPINKYTGTCKANEQNCVGGYSRMYYEIMHLKKAKPNAIVLNAGDNFQGSLWYRYYKWRAVVHFLNKLPIDVQTLGNHEFDDKIDGVVAFLRNTSTQTVVSNIDDKEEPQFQNLYNKSTIIIRSGRKIGVIGAVVSNTIETSRPGKLKFLDEVESINKEAQKLVSKDKVDTIIVLSHCGYFMDLEIARKAAQKISVIVGGHSHSLLYNGEPPANLPVLGPYPTVINHKDGRNILVVQASAFTRFVGDITVQYSKEANVISWAGTPIYLDQHVPTDPDIDKEMKEWKNNLDKFGKTVVGKTLITLDRSNCYEYECNIGNLIADAMVSAYVGSEEEKASPFTTVAMVNSGAIRNSISVGAITIGDLLEVMPFDNTIDVGELQGKYIKECLEHAALVSYGSRNLLQVSGLDVIYNATNPPGSRVVSLKVPCRKCKGPKYEALDMKAMYRIVLNTFLVQGGDGYSAITKNLVNHRVGKIDTDVIQSYLTQKSPITQTVEGRIRFVY